MQKHFTDISSFLIWIIWSMTCVLCFFSFFFNFTCFSKLSKMEYVCLSMPYAKLAWSAHKLHICRWQLLQVKCFIQIQCQSETWAATGFSDFCFIHLLLCMKGSCMCANNVVRDETYCHNYTRRVCILQVVINGCSTGTSTPTSSLRSGISGAE